MRDVTSLSPRVRVDPNGCWTWTGFLTTKGYGQAQVNNRKVTVHRAIYEAVAGPVEDGLQIDHLCRNRSCVNPRHLEPVSSRENTLRGLLPTANRELCLAEVHRIADVGVYVDSDGCERCRQCRLDSKRRYRERRAA